MMPRCLFWLALASGLVTGIASCERTSEPPSESQFKSTFLENPTFGKDFQLRGHHGKLRTLADFRGKVVLMFFGFTHCPDVCPTTLARAAQSVSMLPAGDAKRLQVLFVTLDPERDTASLLKQYVSAFHPSFLGLRTTPDATRELADHFKVYYQRVPGATPQSYSIDHSTFSYVFDHKGKLSLLVAHAQTAAELASDIQVLLNRNKE